MNSITTEDLLYEGLPVGMTVETFKSTWFDGVPNNSSTFYQTTKTRDSKGEEHIKNVWSVCFSIRFKFSPMIGNDIKSVPRLNVHVLWKSGVRDGFCTVCSLIQENKKLTMCSHCDTPVHDGGFSGKGCSQYIDIVSEKRLVPVCVICVVFHKLPCEIKHLPTQDEIPKPTPSQSPSEIISLMSDDGDLESDTEDDVSLQVSRVKDGYVRNFQDHPGMCTYRKKSSVLFSQRLFIPGAPTLKIIGQMSNSSPTQPYYITYKAVWDSLFSEIIHEGQFVTLRGDPSWNMYRVLMIYEVVPTDVDILRVLLVSVTSELSTVLIEKCIVRTNSSTCHFDSVVRGKLNPVIKNFLDKTHIKVSQMTETRTLRDRGDKTKRPESSSDQSPVTLGRLSKLQKTRVEVSETSTESTTTPNKMKGPPGPEGKKGKDGKHGKDGVPGLDGKSGKDGKNGIDGKNGKDGKDGEPGKGSSVSTDDVIKFMKAGADISKETFMDAQKDLLGLLKVLSSSQCILFRVSCTMSPYHVLTAFTFSVCNSILFGFCLVHIV